MTVQTSVLTVTPWHREVRAGDLVAFRFPHETDGTELPKVRPTLVLDVEERYGKRYAVLAYGTTNPRRFVRREPYAIDVMDDGERAEASLRRPTRFHASRRITVSLDNSWFDVSASKGTAVIGRLTGMSLARLHAVRARIEAERDIRKERRRRTRNEARPVTVEVRRKGRTRKDARHV